MERHYYRAAGGVVIHQGRVLLLRRPRSGEVRLPKGHIEDGESPEETALREVMEETGYGPLEVLAALEVQRVEFVDPRRDRMVTRDEHYFLMRPAEGARQRTPEPQFVPFWAPLETAPEMLSFESERRVLRRAIALWECRSQR